MPALIPLSFRKEQGLTAEDGGTERTAGDTAENPGGNKKEKIFGSTGCEVAPVPLFLCGFSVSSVVEIKRLEPQRTQRTQRRSKRQTIRRDAVGSPGAGAVLRLARVHAAVQSRNPRPLDSLKSRIFLLLLRGWRWCAETRFLTGTNPVIRSDPNPRCRWGLPERLSLFR